jgi:hypothetical protein
VAVFAIAAPALADSSSTEGYGGIGGDVLTDIGGAKSPAKAKPKTVPSGAVAGTTSTPTTKSGQLPFTGLDLGLLLGVGLLLVLSGAALRRMSGSGRSTA